MLLVAGQIISVNLQRTKHHKRTDLAIHSYIDDVMKALCDRLGVVVPIYNKPSPVLHSSHTSPVKNTHNLNISIAEYFSDNNVPVKKFTKKEPKLFSLGKGDIKDTTPLDLDKGDTKDTTPMDVDKEDTKYTTPLDVDKGDIKDATPLDVKDAEFKRDKICYPDTANNLKRKETPLSQNESRIKKELKVG